MREDNPKSNRRPKPPRPNQKLISVPQASLKYGPPIRTIRDLIYRGRLQVVRFDGVRRDYIIDSEFERLIEQSTERRDS
jgi:hypothetical protein